MAKEKPIKDEKAEALDRLKVINKEMEKLNKEKVELNKVLLAPEVEVPLNQLNLIALKGAAAAKKALGDKWVE